MKKLTDEQYIKSCIIATKNFNIFYNFGDSDNAKNSDAGIGKAFEPFMKDALTEVTGNLWRFGDKDREADFIDTTGEYESIELKTTLRSSFTGGTTGGRIASIQKNPESNLKYTIDKNDNTKIYVYDPKPYIFIDFDRPWNGYEKFYIKRLYTGDVREVDWNNNRNLTDDAKNNLRLLIDETNSNERYIRMPWQSQNNKDADRGDILKYIILETLNKDTLIECKELINNQLNVINSLKVNSFIQRASEFDDISIDDIINALSKIKEERNK